MNKIQKVSVILAAVAITATQAFALTENWSAAVYRFLTLQGGTTGVPVGDLIEIGLVSPANAALAATATSGAQLQGLMTVFASGLVGDNVGLAGAFSEATASPGAGFFTGQIYLLAFNASTAGAATQGGLFTNPAWVFSASDTAAANSLDLGDAGTTAPRGALSSGTVTSPGDLVGTDAASLALFVPEPSTWMLVGTGLLGLLGLRRRS